MKFYRIKISGEGGEIVFGKATLPQHNFWNNLDSIIDAGFDESDSSDALVYYMLDKEEWESNIPKTARFNYEWYEIDDYGHYNNSMADNAHIEITEVDSKEHDARIINVVYSGSLDNLTVNDTELNLDIELQNGSPYVFYAMEAKTGIFFNTVIMLNDDLDLKKLEFYTVDLPTGDTIISFVAYDGVIKNSNVDTTVKETYMEVWEW